VACEAGKYQAGGGSDACTACLSSSSSPEGSTACTCNAGFTGPDGEESVACETGKYKTEEGSNVCSACAAASSSPEGRHPRS
jgi:hypothetical protein